MHQFTAELHAENCHGNWPDKEKRKQIHIWNPMTTVFAFIMSSVGILKAVTESSDREQWSTGLIRARN